MKICPRLPVSFHPCHPKMTKLAALGMLGGGSPSEPTDPWDQINPILRLEADYGILTTGTDAIVISGAAEGFLNGIYERPAGISENGKRIFYKGEYFIYWQPGVPDVGDAWLIAKVGNIYYYKAEDTEFPEFEEWDALLGSGSLSSEHVELENPAGFLDPVALISNRGTASGAGQSTSGSQGFYLPLIDGKGYLFLPGVFGNFAHVPPASFNGLQYLDIRAKLNLSTFFGFPHIACKRGPNGLDWGFNFQNGGKLNLYGGDWAFGGISPGESDNAVPFPTGVDFWVRGVLDCAAGTAQYFTSSDGSDWTQLGATKATTPWTNPNYATQRVTICGTDGGGDPVRGAMHFISISDASGVLCEVDFSDPTIPDNATSFECATGQEVTIHQSGDNPATLVRRARVRLDGVDDHYLGTFEPNFTGGRVFAAYQALGGANFAVVFSVDAEAGAWNTPDGMVYIQRNNGTEASRTLHNDSVYLSRSDGFSLTETSIQEIWTSMTEISSILNGGDPLTDAGDFSGLNATQYGIGFEVSSINFTAMDWFGTFAIPEDATPDQVSFVRDYINEKYGS